MNYVNASIATLRRVAGAKSKLMFYVDCRRELAGRFANELESARSMKVTRLMLHCIRSRCCGCQFLAGSGTKVTMHADTLRWLQASEAFINVRRDFEISLGAVDAILSASLSNMIIIHNDRNWHM